MPAMIFWNLDRLHVLQLWWVVLWGLDVIIIWLACAEYSSSIVVQEAVQQTVEVIFEDPGVKELISKLYQKGV